MDETHAESVVTGGRMQRRGTGVEDFTAARVRIDKIGDWEHTNRMSTILASMQSSTQDLRRTRRPAMRLRDDARVLLIDATRKPRRQRALFCCS